VLLAYVLIGLNFRKVSKQSLSYSLWIIEIQELCGNGTIKMAQK
jgi:hypothetical protein